MCVVADFSKLTHIKEYEETVAEKLKGVDIALLFLNAGIGNFHPFDYQSNEITEEITNVNVLHTIYTTKVLLNQMLGRPKRSAIVITGSGLGAYPIPGTITYCSSKAFGRYLALGLNYELKDKIDVMHFQCG